MYDSSVFIDFTTWNYTNNFLTNLPSLKFLVVSQIFLWTPRPSPPLKLDNDYEICSHPVQWYPSPQVQRDSLISSPASGNRNHHFHLKRECLVWSFLNENITFSNIYIRCIRFFLAHSCIWCNMCCQMQDLYMTSLSFPYQSRKHDRKPDKILN